jgi:hypothetical protein
MILIFLTELYKQLSPNFFNNKDSSEFSSELEKISEETKAAIDKEFLKDVEDIPNSKKLKDDFKNYIDKITKKVIEYVSKMDKTTILSYALRNIVYHYNLQNFIPLYEEEIKTEIKDKYKDFVKDLDLRNLENKFQEYESLFSKFEAEMEDIEKEQYEKVEEVYLEKALSRFYIKDDITEEDLSFISKTYLEPLYSIKLNFLEKVFEKIKDWVFNPSIERGNEGSFIRSIFSKSNETSLKEIKELFPEFEFIIYFIYSVLNLKSK